MHSIIADIHNGDKDAFHVFFDDYFPILCVFANKYIANYEQSRDIAQDALLIYWEKRSDFDNIFQVKNFLYVTVRNRCLNLIKRDAINKRFLDESLLDSPAFYEENILEQETYLLVRKAVDSLPPQMRNVIRHAMQGLKNSQIAQEMNIAEGTVHALKKTAYRKLREQFKKFIVFSFIGI